MKNVIQLNMVNPNYPVFEGKIINLEWYGLKNICIANKQRRHEPEIFEYARWSINCWPISDIKIKKYK